MLTRDRKPLTEEQVATTWAEPQAGEPLDEAPAPSATPQPCPTCGCPFFWEDLGGRVHCCECVPIPSRRMAAEAWFVYWSPDGAYWGPWEFKHWDPYAHLPAVGGDATDDDSF